MTGVRQKYIIELLNEQKSTTLREYVIDKDGKVVFPYLREGKYCIRITEDINRNGIVDTGVLLEHRQPEKVRFFKMLDKEVFEIPERSEIEQDLDMAKFMNQ